MLEHGKNVAVISSSFSFPCHAGSRHPWNLYSMKSAPIQWHFTSGEVSSFPPHASTKTSRTWEFEALQLIVNIQTWVSSQWVQPFVSSLHMPRRKHQEHGSLECSNATTMQMFGVMKTNMEPWDLFPLQAICYKSNQTSNKHHLCYHMAKTLLW